MFQYKESNSIIPIRRDLFGPQRTSGRVLFGHRHKIVAKNVRNEKNWITSGSAPKEGI